MVAAEAAGPLILALSVVGTPVGRYTVSTVFTGGNDNHFDVNVFVQKPSSGCGHQRSEGRGRGDEWEEDFSTRPTTF